VVEHEALVLGLRVAKVIQEAPYAQKMLKNQISQNGMKPILLRPYRCTDSDNIFTFSNGRCMRELLYFDRFLKKKKKSKD
jgi:hypothetical protein